MQKKNLLMILTFLTLFPISAKGSWLFSTKKLKFPSKKQMTKLFNQNKLGEFLNQTDAAEILNKKKLTAVEIEFQRMALINLYKNNIGRNKDQMQPTEETIKNFNMLIWKLLKKHPKIKNNILQFRQSLQSTAPSL